jgi:hypothetical protein
MHDWCKVSSRLHDAIEDAAGVARRLRLRAADPCRGRWDVADIDAHYVEVLVAICSAYQRESDRAREIRAYLPTGAWEKAQATLEAAEKWQQDVAEGKRLLIELSLEGER